MAESAQNPEAPKAKQPDVNNPADSLVEDPDVKNALEQLYRPGDTVPGGTAGAIEHELKTGEDVGGKRHLQKGRNMSRYLERILKKSLSQNDRNVAERELKRLQDALRTKKQ